MASWPYNTKRWTELRAAKLRRDPQCEYCPAGMQRAATCVDHRDPIRGEGDPRAWHWPNLVSSCWPCHSAKTARGSEAGAVRTNKPRKGCAPDGTPLDGGHWWQKQ
jgi:5-methylcytosine-specific restriction protein A